MSSKDFDSFCERNQSYMYRAAYKILSDVHKAEDATQEAFIRIFRVLRRLHFKSEKAERVYAIRAAKCAAIDILRSEGAEEIEVVESEVDANIPEWYDPTYSAIVAKETWDRIKKHVEQLPEKAKTIFVYRRLGLTDAEIAASLDITISDVRTTACRARAKLAKLLGEEDYDERTR